MKPATVTDRRRASAQIATARNESPSASVEYRALWAMSTPERVAAMWRSQLTLRQLCHWSSRAPHEIPLIGGELAWIVMRTPEWAEATDGHSEAA